MTHSTKQLLRSKHTPTTVSLIRVKKNAHIKEINTLELLSREGARSRRAQRRTVGERASHRTGTHKLWSELCNNTILYFGILLRNQTSLPTATGAVSLLL